MSSSSTPPQFETSSASHARMLLQQYVEAVTQMARAGVLPYNSPLVESLGTWKSMLSIADDAVFLRRWDALRESQRARLAAKEASGG